MLDEPLGALDARLRRQLQKDLRAVQQAVHTTFVYVTHDQEEAMTMSDRVAVIVDGRVEQVGSPSEIYARPQTPYVAAFLGSANLYDATVGASTGDQVTCDLRGHRLVATCGEPVTPGEAVTVMIRPERVTVNESGVEDGTNVLSGTVDRLTYRGANTLVNLHCGELVLEAEVANIHGEPPAWLDPGRTVRVTLSPSALRIMPRQ